MICLIIITKYIKFLLNPNIILKICGVELIQKRIQCFPGNRGRPLSISANIQPTDQISIDLV